MGVADAVRVGDSVGDSVTVGGTAVAVSDAVGAWVMVGRRKGCQVIIDSDRVSRDHAKIFIGPDNQVYVLDADTKNGTFVNNKKLQPYNKEVLKDKGFVGFGPHLFQFYYLNSFYVAVENFFRPKRKP